MKTIKIRNKISQFLISLLVIFPLISVPVKAEGSNLFADVSNWQPDTQEFFDQMVSQGISGVVIKLTAGGAKNDNFINPKAAKQIQAARNLNLPISLYHYAKYQGIAQAQAEANFFANQAQTYGFGKNTLMVADVEDSSLTNPYQDTVAFQAELARLGYKSQVIYSMASWFWNQKVPRTYPAWVAHYNVDQPGVSGIAAWQFTNKFKGMHLDASYDYQGLFTFSQSNPPAVTVKYIPGYGIMLWDNYDINTRRPLYRYLPHGSAWRLFRQAKIKGEYWYELGTNQWIQARYTNFPNGHPVMETILPNSDPNGRPIATIDYLSGYGIMLWNNYDVYTRSPLYRYLPDGSDWKVVGQAKVGDGYWYKLGTNQWIDANYTTNPNGFTKAPIVNK
ncbi:MAG: hypothetical protein M3Z38_03730 [Bombilactobacillus mellifer]|nr:hypothetical protein [Bombilactobacillus mellifer]